MPEYVSVGEYMEQFGHFAPEGMTYHQIAYLDEGTTELSIPQQFTLMWLATMEWYLAQHARGVPVLAVRYDDLNARREQVVGAILTYCGLDGTPVPDLLRVFGRDAQAGTALARDNPEEGNQLRLSERHLEEMHRILQRHTVVRTADFVLPGTLRLSPPL
jgi:hypothetical protein